MLVYNILQGEDETGAVLSEVCMQWSEENEKIARAEAYKGQYRTENIEVPEVPKATAPCNILEGECVTVDGVLYRATGNIPNGEPIVVGQNAVKTTVEEQLNRLTKGE